MSNMGDIIRNPNSAEDFLKFVSYNGDMFLYGVTAQLSSFVENGFLKTLFDKGPQAMDKAQLLVEMFGECANMNNFTIQAKATNIALYASSRIGMSSTDDELFVSTSSSNVKTTPNPVLEMPPILPDVEMTPVDHTFWTTDLGGIPVRWFPASWNLQERKQREKFQAVIHDIPEEMTMATLWNDRKPTTFLMSCGASAFKIIQTSKGKRKLVGYFENWEATLKALDTPQVFLTLDKELKWCQHSVSTLKKKQHKPKAKNTLNKKSGNTGQRRRIRSPRPS
ncbi:unnamed protein product [Rhizophagus irregularis]|nr:unnamed protein product [Rhizophagus irregularis]